MQDDVSQQQSIAQRLTRLATELAELAMTVADQEQRQRQRDLGVQQALAQLAELSASLQSLAGDSASRQPGGMPAAPDEAAPEAGERRSESEEQPRW